MTKKGKERETAPPQTHALCAVCGNEVALGTACGVDGAVATVGEGEASDE